jgi:hypothetical protein
MDTFVQAILEALSLRLLVLVEPKVFSLLVSQLTPLADASVTPPPAATATPSVPPWSDGDAGPLEGPLEGEQGPRASATPPWDVPRAAGGPLPAAAPFRAGGGGGGLTRTSAPPRLTPSLSQVDILAALAGDGDPLTGLISGRGRVGARRGAAVEACEVAAALGGALAARVPVLCAAVDADAAAAELGMTPEQYLRQVRLVWLLCLPFLACDMC